MVDGVADCGVKQAPDAVRAPQHIPACHGTEAGKLRKGEDTMDVWFDSGSSWAGVLGRDADLNYPADLYLEVGAFSETPHLCITCMLVGIVRPVCDARLPYAPLLRLALQPWRTGVAAALL